MKKILLLLGVGLVLLTTNISAQDLRSAIYLTQSQKYDLAENAFVDLIKKEPAIGINYFYAGENLIKAYYADTLSMTKAELLQQAEPIFKKGTVADSANALNYAGLARLYLISARKGDALKMFAKAQSLLIPYKKVKQLKKQNPAAQALVYAKLAQAYIFEGSVDTAGANPYIKKAIEIDEYLPEFKMAKDRNPEIYLIAGDINWLMLDASTAIRYYKTAESIDDSLASTKVRIGDIYLRANSLQVAQEYFEKAISLDKTFSPAYRSLGEIYFMTRKNKEAKDCFEKYNELSAGNIPAKIRYVQSLYRTKDYSEAVKQIEEIQKVDQSRNNLNRLATYCEYERLEDWEKANRGKIGDYSKALNFVETFFKNQPADKVIKKDYDYWSKIILKSKQEYTKQPKIFTDTILLVKAINLAKDDISRLQVKDAAATKKAKGKKVSSVVNPQIELLNKKLDSLNKKYQSIIATIAADYAEIDRGFEKAKIAASFDKNAYELDRYVNNAYYNYKRYYTAADLLRKKLEFGSTDINDRVMIGKCFYQSKDYTKAEEAFNEVIKAEPTNIQGYLWVANTAASQDPELKTGLAKPKYDEVIRVALLDTAKYQKELFDAYKYMFSYYFFVKEDLASAKEWGNKMTEFSNVDYKVNGYKSLAIAYTKAKKYKEAIEAYEGVLKFRADDAATKNVIAQLQSAVKSTEAKINPNEISGVVKDASGKPVMNCSVLVKDASNETYTNANGEYRFEIPKAAAALIFTAPNKKTKTVNVTKSRTYNVTL